MKTNLLALTLLCGIVLLLPSQNLHASGFFGGEIGYRCLGNEVYEITIRSYTECSGMQPDTGVLQATCGSVTVNQQLCKGFNAGYNGCIISLQGFQ